MLPCAILQSQPANNSIDMFLWACLVLQYIAKNIFYRKDEVLTALETLPRELSKL